MSDDMFAGRRFSIPYSASADQVAASMARAHLITRTQTPGQVIQVGDKVIALGVEPDALRDVAKMGDLDARLRSLDQLSSPAQDAVRRNIQWQYGEQVVPQLDSTSMKKSEEAELTKGLVGKVVRGAARALSLDHLVTPEKKLVKIETTPAPAPKTVTQMVPKRVAEPAGRAPIRLLDTPKAPAPTEGPTRLLDASSDRPRSLSDVKAQVAAVKPTPLPAPKPADAPATPAPATPAPAEVTPVADVKPTPAPAPKPAIESTAAKIFDGATVVHNPIPEDTPDSADVSPNPGDEGYTGPDHRAFVSSMQRIHEAHAVARPGFTHAAKWRMRDNQPVGFTSTAHDPESRTTEEHIIRRQPDGTLTHTHRVTAPDIEPYEKTTEGLASFAALHKHVQRHFESSGE